MFRFCFFSRVVGAVGIVLITLLAVWPGLQGEPLPGFVVPSVALQPDAAPQFFSELISTPQVANVHAASIVEYSDRRLFVVWFGGTNEGSADTRIYGVDGVLDASGKTVWGEVRSVVSREETGNQQGRWVRKLGNPVVFADAQYGVGLVYVRATMGGWASSHLNLLFPLVCPPAFNPSQRVLLCDISKDSPEPPASRRLLTSPFFNMSTLVKGAPVFFDNGDIGLPIYHEMAGKFAELLVLDRKGKVQRKIRMDHGRRTLQPVLLVEDATRAIALMRDGSSSMRVWRSETVDAGRNWSVPQQVDLPNPNSALAAVRLDDGRLLAVANDTEDDRLRLSLLVSEDRGFHWRVVYRFDDKQAQFGQDLTEAAFRAQLASNITALGHTRLTADVITTNVVNSMCKRKKCTWQYDYPYLIRARNGDFHLVYSWNKAFVRYVRFNSAWLQARLENAT